MSIYEYFLFGDHKFAYSKSNTLTFCQTFFFGYLQSLIMLSLITHLFKPETLELSTSVPLTISLPYTITYTSQWVFTYQRLCLFSFYCSHCTAWVRPHQLLLGPCSSFLISFLTVSPQLHHQSSFLIANEVVFLKQVWSIIIQVSVQMPSPKRPLLTTLQKSCAPFSPVTLSPCLALFSFANTSLFEIKSSWLLAY